MKKLIFLMFLLSMLCVSCETKPRETIYIRYGNYYYGFDVIVIDSCEYLLGTDVLTHKGNCRFCKERNERYRQRRDSIR